MYVSIFFICLHSLLSLQQSINMADDKQLDKFLTDIDNIGKKLIFVSYKNNVLYM